MDDLTPGEVAAMWLYGAEYARTGLSAVDFYASLSPSRKEIVAGFVTEMRDALKREGR